MQTLEFESITYKFDMISLDGEEEWARWARSQAMAEAEEFSRDWPAATRIPFLAEVSKGASLAQCGFISDFGLQNLQTIGGMAKVLELAARKLMPVPHPSYEVMLRLVKGSELAAVLQICALVIPVSEDARKMMIGDLEKKVSGLKASGLS